MPRVRCVIWVAAPAGQPARPAMGRQSCLPAAKMAVPQWHPRCFSSPTATLRCSRAVRWPCREAAAIPCPESGRLRLRCSAKTARAAPRAARSPPRRRAAACRRGGGRDARAAWPARLDAGSAQPLGRPWAPASAQPPTDQPVTAVAALQPAKIYSMRYTACFHEWPSVLAVHPWRWPRSRGAREPGVTCWADSRGNIESPASSTAPGLQKQAVESL